MVFLALDEVRVAKFSIRATSGRVATILQNSVHESNDFGF